MFDEAFEAYQEPKATLEMIELAREVYRLRDEHTALKAQAANVWAEKEKMEANLVEKMDAMGMKSFDHAEMGTVSVGRTIYGRIVDIDRAREYFENEGIANELLELQLKPKGGKARLNAIIKDCLSEGKMLPEGIDYSEKVGIRRRKS